MAPFFFLSPCLFSALYLSTQFSFFFFFLVARHPALERGRRVCFANMMILLARIQPPRLWPAFHNDVFGVNLGFWGDSEGWPGGTPASRDICQLYPKGRRAGLFFMGNDLIQTTPRGAERVMGRFGAWTPQGPSQHVWVFRVVFYVSMCARACVYIHIYMGARQSKTSSLRHKFSEITLVVDAVTVRQRSH